MANVPEYGQLVEYVTEGPVIHPVRLVQHSLDALPVLQAIQADYQKVAALGREVAMPPEDLDDLRTAASEAYHQDVIEHEIAGPDPVVIVERLAWVRSHLEWHLGLNATKGLVYFCPADNNLYRCVSSHTVYDPAWRPDLPGNAALWIRYYAPEEGPQPWVQPYGGSGTYESDAIVTHNGFVWRNIIPPPALNVWEPGVYGWEKVE